jgi:hypothetical protein
VRPDRAHLLIGCGVVAAAALTGIWAPLNLVLIVALFALLRVCWLEDNITNDLIGRDRCRAATSTPRSGAAISCGCGSAANRRRMPPRCGPITSRR